MTEYKILPLDVTCESQAIRGPKISYLCTRCGDLTPSQPDDNCGCSCGNIFIDLDYFRLDVEEWSCFKIVELLA